MQMTIPYNSPSLWRGVLPWPPQGEFHKYDRGQVVVAGGTVMTGAARLAAQAAMRIGAGICIVAAQPSILPIYQASLIHVISKAVKDLSEIIHLINDTYRNIIVIGPGIGQNDAQMLRQHILSLLNTKIPVVLDADAITAFQESPKELFSALHKDCVLTPHAGEFIRLFPDMGKEAPPHEKALSAAKICGCTVLLKGQETAIAFSEKIVINTHATPWLATAGAGDVLAGMTAGLMAQGMAGFDAACAAAWLHGEAGLRFGPGLVAPDLVDILPEIMRDFA